MHAQRIIQEFLERECSSIHAKRRSCLALVTGAAQRDGLGLIRLSRNIDRPASIHNRIKQCDRLLSNRHLEQERLAIYGALAGRLLHGHRGIGIIVDWSDLLPDISQHVLRASVVVEGRSVTIYEEVHSTASYNVAAVHRQFMITLRGILPPQCLPIIITDAGFRSTWFKMLDELGFPWIGRVRNRDTMRLSDCDEWLGCPELYAGATTRARDLGLVQYVRKSPVVCRMVLIRNAKKGRQNKTAFGKKKQSGHSKKQARTQREPWLLAVSPMLATLRAAEIVEWYARRMQIEQTFRDLKNPQWGMGLSNSRTRKPRRLAALLLIGALLAFALWLIGLAAFHQGYRVKYGSSRKATQTVSILMLARRWLDERRPILRRSQFDQALIKLKGMIKTYQV